MSKYTDNVQKYQNDVLEKAMRLGSSFRQALDKSYRKGMLPRGRVYLDIAFSEIGLNRWKTGMLMALAPKQEASCLAYIEDCINELNR